MTLQEEEQTVVEVVDVQETSLQVNAAGKNTISIVKKVAEQNSQNHRKKEESAEKINREESKSLILLLKPSARAEVVVEYSHLHLWEVVTILMFNLNEAIIEKEAHMNRDKMLAILLLRPFNSKSNHQCGLGEVTLLRCADVKWEDAEKWEVEEDLITKFMMIRDLNNSILKVKVDKDTIMKVSAEVITMEAIRADLLDMTTKVKDFIHSLEVVVDTNEEDQWEGDLKLTKNALLDIIINLSNKVANRRQTITKIAVTQQEKCIMDKMEDHTTNLPEEEEAI